MTYMRRRFPNGWKPDRAVFKPGARCKKCDGAEDRFRPITHIETRTWHPCCGLCAQCKKDAELPVEE